MKTKTPRTARQKTLVAALRPAPANPRAATPARVAPAPALGARASYRHGDLRRALLEAGVDLARGGGPQAVVLREATRRAGVVPNAAYRHFASHAALFAAVRAAALAGVAQAMTQEIAALAPLPPAPTPHQVVAHARGCVRAVGRGYLRFALAETGLFRTAFAAFTPDEPGASAPGLAQAPAVGGANPFELLGAELDRLVEAGVLPPARRPGAEYLAWSAVHGMALLLLDGPLQATRGDAAAALGQRLLDMVERGI